MTAPATTGYVYVASSWRHPVYPLLPDLLAWSGVADAAP